MGGSKNMNNLNVLDIVSKMTSVGVSGSCRCDKNDSNTSMLEGSGFDLVVESLIRAISVKTKNEGTDIKYSPNDIFSNEGEDSGLLDNIVPPILDINNAISKIEPTNKDESVNIRIKNAVSKASKKHGIDADLIMSVIKVESSFNPKCVSKAGAEGLMQLMPVNVKDYGVKDVFNIEENIDAGTRQLKDYIAMFDGSLEMGLMAYNAGQGTMRKRGVTSPADLYKMPRETQNYIPKVLNLYKGR